MDNLLLAIIAVLMLIIIILLIIFIKNSSKHNDTEFVKQIEALERLFYETTRDLRTEQNTLARATRIENQSNSDKLSEQIDKRVARLADLTNQSLEQIRFTVDERLNESLDKKFSMVSARLEEMHRGIGEMQTLAGGVNDLKRILTNVKTRGIWGEMQLAALIYDVLPKTMVVENAEIEKGSGCRVEFALIIPSGDKNILLPVDAKFPQEDYQRLLSARECGDADAAANALKQLEKRIKSEAKDIRDKYIKPPYSTDFAVMYLSSEGLFNEAVNIPGLVDLLQNTYRVCIAGPTTLTALLNSLQIGFRTIAIQQNNEKVWELLSGIKNDVNKLAMSLEKTGKKLIEAENSIESAVKRANILQKNIGKVEELNSRSESVQKYEQ